jgi:hypothetical protein
MRQALASVRAEGLEPDEVGMDLIRRVDRGELTSEQAIEAYPSPGEDVPTPNPTTKLRRQ